MYILRQKWSQLNAVQREEVVSRYKADLVATNRVPRFYLHNLNMMSFRIHPKSGKVLFV